VSIKLKQIPFKSY